MSRRQLSLLLVSVTVYGCGLFGKAEEDPFLCGAEDGPPDQEIRTCFIRHYETCSPAVVTSQQYTVHGDPTYQRTEIVGMEDIPDVGPRCIIDVYIDYKDRWGIYGKYNLRCWGLMTEETMWGWTDVDFEACQGRFSRWGL